jgi:hypothetical protein
MVFKMRSYLFCEIGDDSSVNFIVLYQLHFVTSLKLKKEISNMMSSIWQASGISRLSPRRFVFPGVNGQSLSIEK